MIYINFKYTESRIALSDIGFTQNDMALMLGVSKRTVENRFAEFNMTRIDRYSDIDDSSLDVYTKHIITLFPRSGTVPNSM